MRRILAVIVALAATLTLAAASARADSKDTHPMAQPGTLGNLVPPGDSYVAERFADLQRQIDALRTGRDLQAATIGSGGLTVDGSGGITVKDGGNVDVQSGGSLNVDGPFNATGDSTIGGDLTIDGTLHLPANSVDDDALVNPVSPAVKHGDGSSFAVGLTFAVKASVTFDVPAGFTRAVVIAVGNVSAWNTSPDSGGIGVRVYIDGAGAAAGPGSSNVAPGNIANATAGSSRLLTNLGSSFKVDVRANAGPDSWSADATNVASVDAMVLFLR